MTTTAGPRTDEFDDEPTGPEHLFTRANVGWTPYYTLASGMVTEIGSSLSHGAVVAREYGLPLVSCVENATRIFHTGEQVELDGTRGTVRRLDGTEP